MQNAECRMQNGSATYSAFRILHSAFRAERHAMTPAFAIFLIIGTIAVASSILVVAMRNPVHSALFLLLTFLCVAVLFVMKGAEFVGAVQVLVYAGGIMVLFLFVVMLINVRHLPDEKVLSSFWKGGLLVFLALFVLFTAVVRP